MFDKRVALLVSVLLNPLFAHAAYSSDTGKIIAFYSSASGHVAVRLDGGTPNANAANQCPDNNTWIGLAPSSTDAGIKSALLAAKMAGSSVTLITVGCATTGSQWLGLKDIYIN